MIPVEVGEPSIRILLFQQQQNEKNIRVELKTTNEVQDMARIREEERSVVNKMSAYVKKKENVHRRVFIKKYV